MFYAAEVTRTSPIASNAVAVIVWSSSCRNPHWHHSDELVLPWESFQSDGCQVRRRQAAMHARCIAHDEEHLSLHTALAALIHQIPKLVKDIVNELRKARRCVNGGQPREMRSQVPGV